MEPAHLDNQLRDSSEATLSTPAAADPGVVSEYEKKYYYHGISSDPPPLLWRSDLETNPFPVAPGTPIFQIPIKSVHGVFGAPLQAVWDEVAPRILEAVEAHALQFTSLLAARFVSEPRDGGTVMSGPLVVWITVRPGAADTAGLREATSDIHRILAEAQVTDVPVEWTEGKVVRL